MKFASLIAFGCALLFGLGLGIAKMTLPSKIIGFLDIGGNWDPSLMFVMVGAIPTYACVYQLALRRQRPHHAMKFDLPAKRNIDLRLVIGAFLFGVGWGVGGFCPGPAIVGIVTGAPPVLLFIASMVVSLKICRRLA